MISIKSPRPGEADCKNILQDLYKQNSSSLGGEVRVEDGGRSWLMKTRDILQYTSKTFEVKVNKAIDI